MGLCFSCRRCEAYVGDGVFFGSFDWRVFAVLILDDAVSCVSCEGSVTVELRPEVGVGVR